MKLSIMDFLSLLRIWSHLLKKSLMENFMFCAVKFAKAFPLNSMSMIIKFHQKNITGCRKMLSEKKIPII